MYRYETHLHTLPVSRCARESVRHNLAFYRELGYDGIFLTNHFLDGNVNIDASLPYEEKLAFYFSDYEEALRLAPEFGIKVFGGVEISHGGTDFLIYGLEPDWYLAHPGIMDMTKREELDFMRSEGALVIQAHPFREANYIDHIRLYPQSVDGIEVINANRTPHENRMAQIYAEEYGLLQLAGTDNHKGMRQDLLAGVETDEPLDSVADFIRAVREQKTRVFRIENPMFDE